MDNIKKKECNLCVIGISEGEKSRGEEEMFEGITADNFPKENKDTTPQIREAHAMQNRIINNNKMHPDTSYSDC